MQTPRAISSRALAAGALCLALALGGQALADSVTTRADVADTGELLGSTASSYLTGIKKFAAAAMWNRMDPLLHNYYHGVAFDDQLYLLPTVAMVQSLDPTMVQPYYIGSWLLIRNDRIPEGIEMAERGVEVNPEAGILFVNLAQVQMLYQDDLDSAVEIGKQVLDRPMQWTDVVEQHNAYPILGAIFRAAGRDDLDALVQQELQRFDEESADELEGVEHDHDGDGVPDH